MTLAEAVISLAVAVAAGGLIGAERQQAQTEGKKKDFGGIRTFPLVALAGASAGLLRPSMGALPFVVLLASVAAFLAISRARASEQDLGVSTEVAAVVTFALGAVAASPDVLPDSSRYLLVGAIAGTTMALLALKRPLHGFIARVSEDDVYATAKFVLLALVFLPILPNQNYGPLDAFNPFKAGLFTALVAGISFAGYLAVRLFGTGRGMILTGLFGGLASSTAVTLTLAGRANQQQETIGLSSVAIVAASSTMFARLLLIIGLRDRPLLSELAAPLGAMAATGYIGALFLFRKEKERGLSNPVLLSNPFELKRALQFGLLYLGIQLVAKAAQIYAGERGVYVSAILAGLADVDAITLSLTEMHVAGTAADVAANGIGLAAITNTLVKVAIAAVVGGGVLGLKVAGVMLAALALGGVVLAIT